MPLLSPSCHVQALELEDLPEDDEEDIDFTLEGLLGPLESDADDHVPEAEPEEAMPQGKAAASKSRRHTGGQDHSRCAQQYMLPTSSQVLVTTCCYCICCSRCTL